MKFLLIFAEVLAAAVVGILLYFPLNNPELAKLTWAVGLLYMVSNLKQAKMLHDELEPVHTLCKMLGFKDKCEVEEISEILEYYLKIDSDRLGPLRSAVVKECRCELRRLAVERASQAICDTQYYDWLMRMLRLCKKGDRVLAVSTMDESAWTDVLPEQRYLQQNIEAAKRGVHVDRIFITTQERLAKVPIANVLGKYVRNRNMRAYIVLNEVLSAQDSHLLSEVGPGFILFNSEIVMIDSSVPPGSAAGKVSMNDDTLQKYADLFKSLLIHAELVDAKYYATLHETWEKQKAGSLK